MCRETFPGFAVIDEETGLINDLEGYSNDFFEDVGSVTGGGVVTAIFDPVQKWIQSVGLYCKGCGRQRRFPEGLRRICWRRWRTSDPGWQGWW